MIVERLRGRQILVRYREGRERKEMKLSTHPYCFVRDEDADFIPSYGKEDGYTGLYGEPLVKLIFGEPADVGRLKNDFDTWEANIPFVNRVLIDTNTMIPNYEHRVWHFDMEWKSLSGELTVISVHDTYTDKLFTWFLDKDQASKNPTPVNSMKCKEHPDGHEEVFFPVSALRFNNEKDMIQHFVRHLQKHDPDVIAGWFVVGADIRQLVERMEANGLDPKSLSPMKRHRYEYRDDWAQPIPGRLCIDLMAAWVKLWEMKNGKLPNKKLDTAAWESLGDRKVPLPNGHDTYYSDIGTYVDYNRQDVKLLPRLNAVNNAIEHFLAIQHIVGCDFRTTPFITKIFTILALRDSEFKLRIPSKPQFEKVSYSGADIMEPKPGLYENIGIMDVKAMYHSNVHKYGISWETIDEDGQDIGNGLCFDTTRKGLLCRQMDLMTELRNEYKASMKSAKTDEERRRYDSLQYATKSLVASMYGCAGDSKYGMYHPSVAAAITFTSRRTLGQLRESCEERGCEVVYGHTDSVFVKVPTPEQGVDMLRAINAEMHPIETEFEKWASWCLIMRKNRYACNIGWSDGDYCDSSIYIKGIELKQSRMPQVMKDSMHVVIDGLLNGRNQGGIVEDIISVVKRVVSGDYPLEDLFMRGRLERDLSEYKVLSESRAAADWANKRLGKGYGAGSSFHVALDSSGKYIAFDEPSEIEGYAEIGYKQIAERFVVDKVEPYFRLMKWDFQAVLNSLNGLSELQWL